MDKNKEVKTTTEKAAAVKAEPVKTATPVADKKDEKVTAAKPAAKKATPAKTTTEKKTTAVKKPAAKKATAKKATKKAEIKTAVAVQFAGKEVFTDTLLEQVKKAWVDQFEGNIDDIKTIELYVKPEEMKAYFVVNGLSNGNYFINL